MSIRIFPYLRKWSEIAALSFCMILIIAGAFIAFLYRTALWFDHHEDVFALVVGIVSMVGGLFTTFTASAAARKIDRGSRSIVVKLKLPEGYVIKTVDPNSEASLREFLSKVDGSSNERHASL